MDYKKSRKLVSMVESIMENFDFVKTHSTMKKLNWVWASSNGVPDIETLRNRAEQLIWGAIEGLLNDKKISHQTPYIYATGGFKATAYKNRYNRIDLIRLEFILTDWESEI